MEFEHAPVGFSRPPLARRQVWALQFLIVLISGSAAACTAWAGQQILAPVGVIGHDDRKPVYDQGAPWNAVGKIFVPKISSAKDCTGTLIDPKIVVTAAHCLFDSTSKRRVKPLDIHFLVGYRLEKYAAHSVAQCIKINPDYTFSRTPTQENATADYAFLILREPVTIPAARFYNKDTITQDDRLVHAGYCCDRRYLLSAHDGCQVKYRWRNAYLTDCDIAAGASGGPVFVKKNDKHYLAAVMTTMFAGDETQQEPLNAVTSILQERDNMDEIKNCR